MRCTNPIRYSNDGSVVFCKTQKRAISMMNWRNLFVRPRLPDARGWEINSIFVSCFLMWREISASLIDWLVSSMREVLWCVCAISILWTEKNNIQHASTFNSNSNICSAQTKQHRSRRHMQTMFIKFKCKFHGIFDAWWIWKEARNFLS